MRCTALTALFFALFALFSTMAYAAPVSQGAIIKRQDQPCMWSCRDATGSGTPASSNNDNFKVLSNIILQLITLMGGNTNNNTTSPPTLVSTSPSSAAAPAADPTGMHQSVPTFKWFTEIAIPSPTPGIA